MAPLLELELESTLGSSARRPWMDSMMLLIIPTNSLFAGDGIMRRATRWPMVSAVLHRPDRSVVGVLRMRYSRESGSPSASSIMTLVNEKVK